MSLTLASPDFYLYGIACLHLGVSGLIYLLVNSIRNRRWDSLVFLTSFSGMAWNAVEFYRHLPALWWPQASEHVENALLDALSFLLLGLTYAALAQTYRWWSVRPKKAPRG